MMLHPRFMEAEKQMAGLKVDILRLFDKADVTDVEALQVCQELAGVFAVHLLRRERHPRHPDHKAGEACSRRSCPGYREDA